MAYAINFEPIFIEEYENIYNYIFHTLHAPMSALRFRSKLKEKIFILKETPTIYQKIPKIDKLKRQYFKVNIFNYVLLYTIDSKSKIVYISHIYYSKRNYLTDLL